MSKALISPRSQQSLDQSQKSTLKSATSGLEMLSSHIQSSSQLSSVSTKMNVSKAELQEIKRLKNEISQMKNDMHSLRSERSLEKYPIETSPLNQKPFSHRSSTLPIDFTANLKNILEHEEEYGKRKLIIDTADDKIKIQVFDLRKPEEGTEAPLISSIWREQKKQQTQVKPKEPKKQFKRKLTFEKQFTSGDMDKPITVTVSDIKEQNEQEDSEEQIPLIGLWGGNKKKEQDSFEQTGVYCSPEGRREKNTLKKSITLQSSLSENENIFKIDIHELKDEKQTNQLTDLWKNFQQQHHPTRQENKTAHFKENSSEIQHQKPSFSEISSVKSETKNTPPPPVTRSGRQSERALNYMAGQQNKRFQKLISAAMTSSSPYKAQKQAPKSKGLKAFLHQQDVYSKAVQFLANDIENFVLKKPGLHLDKHSLSESSLSLGKKSLSSLFSETEAKQESKNQPLKSPEIQENIIEWVYSCVGPKNFEYLIELIIEYSSLQNFSSNSFSLDLYSVTKMHKDFESVLALSKKEIEIMYKKSSQETKSLQIDQFFYILLEIANRVYPGIEQTTGLDKLVRDLILKCDKMQLIRKFRDIQDWRRQANDSPVLQMMQLENNELLYRNFEEFAETNNSGNKLITGPGLARLFQKLNIIPDLLSTIESIRLFFFAQKPSAQVGLLEELDFSQFKALLVFVSQAAIRTSQSPHQKFQSLLRILSG